MKKFHINNDERNTSNESTSISWEQFKPWIVPLGILTLFVVVVRTFTESTPPNQNVDQSRPQPQVERPSGPRVVREVTWTVSDSPFQVNLEPGEVLRVKPGQIVHKDWGWYDPRDGSHCRIDRDGNCDGTNSGRGPTWVKESVKPLVPYPDEKWLAGVVRENTILLNVPQGEIQFYQGNVTLEIVR